MTAQMERRTDTGRKEEIYDSCSYKSHFRNKSFPRKGVARSIVYLADTCKSISISR